MSGLAGIGVGLGSGATDKYCTSSFDYLLFKIFSFRGFSENTVRIWIDIMEHRWVICKGLHLSVILRRFSERIEEFTDKKSVRWVVYLCIYDFFSEKLL